MKIANTDSPNNVIYKWNDCEPLKGTYVNEYASKVTTYKLSKEEMESYLNGNKDILKYKKGVTK